MKMTGEARPSEKDTAEKSELSVSVILIEESKEKQKTLVLLRALVELVVECKELETISDKKGVKKKNEDITETQQEMQITGGGKGIKKKVVETVSDTGVSGKVVDLGEKEEPEKNITETLLVFEKIHIEEKTSSLSVLGLGLGLGP